LCREKTSPDEGVGNVDSSILHINPQIRVLPMG
jgi:hypothetical protein